MAFFLEATLVTQEQGEGHNETGNLTPLRRERLGFRKG